MVDDSDLQLPVASLQPDPAVLEIIEASKVNAFIGALIIRAHEKKIRKITILSWDSEEAARISAQILTVALSLQIDRKCALVFVEGIRFNCESFATFSRVTLPEIETPALADKIENFIENMDRIFPFHVFIGPTIKDWDKQKSTKAKMALNADAHILLMPETGFSRDTASEIESFAKAKKLNWLGAISYPEGTAS